MRTLYIEKASPWENDCNEAFNSELHDEALNGEIFYSLEEARILIEAWRRHDNTERPHSSSAIARQPRRSCRGCLASLVTGRSAGYSSHGVWYHDPLLSNWTTHQELARESAGAFDFDAVTASGSQ